VSKDAQNTFDIKDVCTTEEVWPLMYVQILAWVAIVIGFSLER